MGKTARAYADQVPENVALERFVAMRSGTDVVYKRHNARSPFMEIRQRGATRHACLSACMALDRKQQQPRPRLLVMQQRKRNECTHPMRNNTRPSAWNACTVTDDARPATNWSCTRVNERPRAASQTRKRRSVQLMHISHNFNP